MRPSRWRSRCDPIPPTSVPSRASNAPRNALRPRPRRQVALLQRHLDFIHGDLMGNNIICAPPSGVGSNHIGDCIFIDTESSTLSIMKRRGAMVGEVKSEDRRLMLGRTLDAEKTYFVEPVAELTGAARAFDMHMFTQYWLLREFHGHSTRMHGGSQEARAVIGWLAAFHERACNLSRADFDRLRKMPKLSGAAKHKSLATNLRSCFWPERLATEILHSGELATCEHSDTYRSPP